MSFIEFLTSETKQHLNYKKNISFVLLKLTLLIY